MSVTDKYVDSKINDQASDAVDWANDLISDAAECINALIKSSSSVNSETMQKQPMLVIGHALLQHLERVASQQREYQSAIFVLLNEVKEKISDIAESTDFIASESPSPARFNRVTDKEKNIIRNALINNFLANQKHPPSKQEHDIEMSRIEFIANGWCWNG